MQTSFVYTSTMQNKRGRAGTSQLHDSPITSGVFQRYWGKNTNRKTKILANIVANTCLHTSLLFGMKIVTNGGMHSYWGEWLKAVVYITRPVNTKPNQVCAAFFSFHLRYYESILPDRCEGVPCKSIQQMPKDAIIMASYLCWPCGWDWPAAGMGIWVLRCAPVLVMIQGGLAVDAVAHVHIIPKEHKHNIFIPPYILQLLLKKENNTKLIV